MFNDPDLVKITSQILIVGALIFLAYVGGRITRRVGLGEIVGQILGGFVGGPLLMSYSHKLAEQYPHVEEMLKWSFPLKQVHNYAIVSFVFFMPIYLGVILFSITDESTGIHHIVPFTELEAKSYKKGPNLIASILF